MRLGCKQPKPFRSKVGHRLRRADRSRHPQSRGSSVVMRLGAARPALPPRRAGGPSSAGDHVPGGSLANGLEPHGLTSARHRSGPVVLPVMKKVRLARRHSLPVSSPLPCRLPPPRFSAPACASCVGMRSGWYIEADEMVRGLVAAFITGLSQVVPFAPKEIKLTCDARRFPEGPAVPGSSFAPGAADGTIRGCLSPSCIQGIGPSGADCGCWLDRSAGR